MGKRLNWEELKREYILGDYSSLREFADKKGLSYNGNFTVKTIGWNEQKDAALKLKSSKIIEKTIEKQAQLESNRTIKQLQLADMILEKVQKVIEDELTSITHFGETKETDIIQHSKLEKLMNILEKAQKVQRVAEGLDVMTETPPPQVVFMSQPTPKVHDPIAIEEWNKKVVE